MDTQAPQNIYTTDNPESTQQTTSVCHNINTLQCKVRRLPRQKFPLWQLHQEEPPALTNIPCHLHGHFQSSCFPIHIVLYPIHHSDSPTLQINVICLFTSEYQIPLRRVTNPQYVGKTGLENM